MRAREVERIIRQAGGEPIRTVGSHRRWRITVGELTVSTTVPQHRGDIPTGTLNKIEQDLEPVMGERWLHR